MSTTTFDQPSSARLEDADLAAALVGDLLSRASHEKTPVVKLTDEELTVLDGTDSRQLAPRPWFTELAETSREVALGVALRGLIVRGLVVPSAVEESTGRTSLDMDDDVHAALVARRAASSVVIAERQTNHASWSKVCYLQGNDGVVEEDVSPGGLHTLWAGPVSGLADSLARFADPDDVAAQEPTRPPREVALEDVARGTAQVGPSSDSLYVTVIGHVYLDNEGASATRRLSVFAGTDAVEAASSVDDRKVVRIEEVSRPELRSAVEHLLGVVA
ncbi:hypothetical protein CLV30_101296 [Haloactinopolyspora alba]|uniref:ESAT-6 protein secretion system EspG family protein n=1 Tax=Haloactinopolyspora alba TaxID=648780 RepID=A0A2P8EFS7_9ACTN|nr:hypothetical protein [Haloactinopolyspora alba]PSL08325.1 hypothetical protein CLV30_101296 [Haloactinopolyspora alba]